MYESVSCNFAFEATLFSKGQKNNKGSCSTTEETSTVDTKVVLKNVGSGVQWGYPGHRRGPSGHD